MQLNEKKQEMKTKSTNEATHEARGRRKNMQYYGYASSQKAGAQRGRPAPRAFD